MRRSRRGTMRGGAGAGRPLHAQDARAGRRRAAVREHRLVRAGQGESSRRSRWACRRCSREPWRHIRASGWSTAARSAAAMDREPGRRRPPDRRRVRDRRWPRPPARATSSPAASPISTGSSASTRAWSTPRSGEILKVVSNDDPKLQDRAQLSAILQLVGRAHRCRRSACRPSRPTSRRGAGRLPTEALTDYSRGLLFESARRPGEGRRRLPACPRRAYPDYPEARDGLQRVARGGLAPRRRKRRAAIPRWAGSASAMTGPFT